MTTKVATFPTLSKLSEFFSISFLYTGDFTGNGLEDIIVVGRSTASLSFELDPESYPRYTINIVTQQSGGNFRLATEDLLSPGDALIYGSEPAIVIEDFNADGVDDFFIGGGTDTNYRVPSFFYLSNPSGQYTRQTIETNKWIHGIAAGDADGDGVPEIFTAGYDSVHHYLKYENGGLVMRDLLTSWGEPTLFGGSSIVVGDFLGDGSIQAVRTDDGTAEDGGATATKLYDLSFDRDGNVRFDLHSILPPGRFGLAKWDHLDIMPGEVRSHDVKVYARDLDYDGLKDLVVLSCPWMSSQGEWQEYSEVQILMNQGSGRFTDETESRLFDFDTSLSPSHYLKFIDVNGDGHDDIYLNAHAFGRPASKRVLLNDGEGRFYQADTGPLTNWAAELDTWRVSEHAALTKSTPMTIVRGEHGQIYLAALAYLEDGADTDWKHTWDGTLFVRPGTEDLFPNSSFPGATPHLRQDVLELTKAEIHAYSYEYGVLKVRSDVAAWTMHSPGRVQLEDALYAFDTQAPTSDTPAGAVWQVAALYQAAFGFQPDISTKSRWIAEADRLNSIEDLAQALIDHYAPEISTVDLVMHLYTRLVGSPPASGDLDYLISSVGPGSSFETQGALFAYAATLPMNTENLSGIVGSIQELDSGWF